MEWCEPRDFRDWIRRCLSLLPLTFVLVVLLLFVLEFRFDWMERALGAYLHTTNQKRPETGVIWDAARDTQQARNFLDEITLDRQTIQRNARSANDLSDIASLIANNESAWISPDHFRSMYMNLPDSIASQIMSPVDLAQLFGEGRWDRTYIRGYQAQLEIYLIGRDNQVLREIDLPADTVMQIERSRSIFAGSLEEWGALPGQIYPADLFFSALSSLPEDVRADLLSQPERVIGAGGRIVRVGFVPQTSPEWVDIGFEFEDGSKRTIIVEPAMEWALRRLEDVLYSMSVDSLPASSSTEEQIPQ